METAGAESCPLPEHPALAEIASALNASGSWGLVIDAAWQTVYMTDDVRLSNGALRELVPVPTGVFRFNPEAIDAMLAWSGAAFALDASRAELRTVAHWLLADLPGGWEALRDRVDPRIVDALDDPEPAPPSAALTFRLPASYSAGGARMDVLVTAVRIRDESGRLAGTAYISKPAAGMSVLGTLTAAGDLRHFKRMQQVARPARHPAAILFADLEASSALARRLSTASFFALGRRLVRGADQCVVDGGGLVGRHAGDGMVAFFLADDAGGESAAAYACIRAARGLRDAAAAAAARSGLPAEEVVLRFGLHWGSTLHVGQITSAARAEINALGDEMNEAARIEACATGGRVLASKALIERLDPEDATGLDLDPDRLTYTTLANLPSATDKARRDAPDIAVCELFATAP